MRKNQKIVENNGKLVVRNYPENKQPKFIPPNRPSCNRNNWLECDKGFYCKIFEYIVNKQNDKLIKKCSQTNHYFSTRLPYANEKSREKCSFMANNTYTPTEDMNNSLQRYKKITVLKKFQSNSMTK